MIAHVLLTGLIASQPASPCDEVDREIREGMERVTLMTAEARAAFVEGLYEPIRYADLSLGRTRSKSSSGCARPANCSLASSTIAFRG